MLDRRQPNNEPLPNIIESSISNPRRRAYDALPARSQRFFLLCSRDFRQTACRAIAGIRVNDTPERTRHAAPARLLGVLLAAHHDNPEKQDRQHNAYDSNHGSVHRSLSFPDKIEFDLSSPKL